MNFFEVTFRGGFRGKKEFCRTPNPQLLWREFSKGRLLEIKNIKPYYDYCEHCDVLYRRVLGPLGYEFDIDRSNTDKARCRATVKKQDN